MRCRICGSELGVSFRERSGMCLCGWCHAETPRKASRADFELIYWEGQADSVPLSTRQSFWEDYKNSTYGPISDYIDATREDINECNRADAQIMYHLMIEE